MIVGQREFMYEAAEGWGELPAGWDYGDVPGVATDSHDRVYVLTRSEHPVIVFDREGHFLRSWVKVSSADPTVSRLPRMIGSTAPTTKITPSASTRSTANWSRLWNEGRAIGHRLRRGSGPRAC